MSEGDEPTIGDMIEFFRFYFSPLAFPWLLVRWIAPSIKSTLKRTKMIYPPSVTDGVPDVERNE